MVYLVVEVGGVRFDNVRYARVPTYSVFIFGFSIFTFLTILNFQVKHMGRH